MSLSPVLVYGLVASYTTAALHRLFQAIEADCDKPALRYWPIAGLSAIAWPIAVLVSVISR